MKDICRSKPQIKLGPYPAKASVCLRAIPWFIWGLALEIISHLIMQNKCEKVNQLAQLCDFPLINYWIPKGSRNWEWHNIKIWYISTILNTCIAVDGPICHHRWDILCIQWLVLNIVCIVKHNTWNHQDYIYVSFISVMLLYHVM